MRAVLLILSFLLLAPTASAQSGATIEQPVPFGSESQVDAYMVRVVEVEADATKDVLEWIGSAARQPAFGHIFAVVWIQATYVGSGAGSGAELNDASFVGAEFGQLLGTSCPQLTFEQLNGDRAAADILPHETVELGYCLELRPGEIHQTLLHFGVGEVSVFFSLDPASGTPSTGTPVASPAP